MIRFACPKCARKLALDDSKGGGLGKCPACSEKFRIPAAAPKAEDEDTPALQAVQTEPAKAAPRPAVKVDQLEIVDDEDEAPIRKAPPTGVTRSKSPGVSRRVDDEEEVVEVDPIDDEIDDLDDQPRKKKKKAKDSTPVWAIVTAAVMGVAVLGLAPVAYFFKYGFVALVAIGLPTALLSRKSQLIGGVGALYLVLGVGFFFLNRYVDSVRPFGPPLTHNDPAGADAHCAKLLTDMNKIEARAWLRSKGDVTSGEYKVINNIVEDAYKHGAKQVYATNLDQKDTLGHPAPDLVAEAPTDAAARKEFLLWYGNKVSGMKYGSADVGQKYAYLELD